ncbi:MAG: FecR domain-containing protein [Bacteroidia bacterium]|nr:FecR domain-containing protein [Bacteroidia bacterium]NND24819.1 FecR family protein [Flavobacteriaceae bacterium]MBT8277976.1 FecR domain-containing protein [Bacteroidia bacterium]NNK60415.1 FecR family protein [Flavobacteriaceae bacterium]NNL32703.1 FecR family protein [Flavobacteriaceae bacterium]
MTREELILKWLDNDLSPNEIEAFEALDDHKDLVKLSYNVRRFKAPDFNESDTLNKVLSQINTETSASKVHWLSYIGRIAAVIAIGFSIYFYTTTLDTTISTEIAQKTMVDLPDQSEVTLNAKSTITYNKKDWNTVRDVNLNGEAFFKVAKGESFQVNTTSGKVTVLGTQFNVKHRDNIFEVICYEGSVQVTHNETQKILKPGDSFLILDGKYIAKEKETNTSPSWMNNESYFQSMPFAQVISEFERQYDITINSLNVDQGQLFTGSFVHNNKTLALKSITLPLNLKYRELNANTIVLERE